MREKILCLLVLGEFDVGCVPKAGVFLGFVLREQVVI